MTSVSHNLPPYHVEVRDGDYVRVRRLDGAAIGAGWFHAFQRLKAQTTGAESEWVMLWPAESRLVDVVNVYHFRVGRVAGVPHLDAHGRWMSPAGS